MRIRTIGSTIISAAFLLLETTYAVAQQALPADGGAPLPIPKPTFASTMAEMLPMFAIVFMIFYFMVLKPQQTKVKQQEALIQGLKKGDEVSTTAGLIGRVAGIEKDHILLEVANGVKVKVETAHVTKKIEKEKSAQAA